MSVANQKSGVCFTLHFNYNESRRLCDGYHSAYATYFFIIILGVGGGGGYYAEAQLYQMPARDVDTIFETFVRQLLQGKKTCKNYRCGLLRGNLIRILIKRVERGDLFLVKRKLPLDRR